MATPIWYLYNAVLALEFRCNSLGEIANFLAGRPFEERPTWFAWTAGMAEWTPVPQVLGAAQAPERPGETNVPVVTANLQTVNLESTLVEVADTKAAPVDLLQNGPVASLAPLILQASGDSPNPQDEITKVDSTAPDHEPALSVSQTSVTLTPVGGRPLPQNWAERRKHPRIPLRLRIIIVSGGKTFRTFTKDVSEGGFMMEKPLPWSPGNELCTVYLSQEEDPQQIELRVCLLMQPGNPRRFAFQQTPKEFLARLQDWLFAGTKSVAA